MGRCSGCKNKRFGPSLLTPGGGQIWQTDNDIKELATLGGELERLAKIERYQASGNGADLIPNLSHQRKGKKRNPSDKSYFTDEALKQLNDACQDDMFAYQHDSHAASHQKISNYL